MAVDRPKMTREERAKQFLPFSAVRGLEEALEKKRAALFHSEKPILAPDRENEIDRVLRTLKKGDRIKIVYYIGDEEIIETNVVKAISSEKRALALDKGSVGFDAIISISVEESRRKRRKKIGMGALEPPAPSPPD